MIRVLVVSVVCAVCTPLLGVELSGRVVDESDQPIQDALVVVSTCKPRSGPATMCPSCYPDCAKKAKTDANGSFRLTGLSSKLLFRLGIGATAHQGLVTDHLDPAEPPQAAFVLKRFPESDEVRRIRGSVRDLSGNPIVGAEIRSQLVRRGAMFSSAADPNVTPLTLTGEEGDFVTTVDVKVDSVTWRVSAAGYAPLDIEWTRAVGEDPMQIKLGRGASIRGQLVFDGEPIPHALVGAVQENRLIGNLVTPQEVSTDEEGYFRFDSLPPDRDYTLYTMFDQDIPGVLPVSLVAAPSHGQRVELGPVPTEPSQTLTVTFETTDGSELPAEGYLYVGRSKAWHSARLSFGGGGRSSEVLKVRGVGNELVELLPRVQGYSVESTQPPLASDLNSRYPHRIGDSNSIAFRLAPRTGDAN